MIDKNKIAQAVKRELTNLYGERLTKILLYGSYARERIKATGLLTFDKFFP